MRYRVLIQHGADREPDFGCAVAQFRATVGKVLDFFPHAGKKDIGGEYDILLVDVESDALGRMKDVLNDYDFILGVEEGDHTDRSELARLIRKMPMGLTRS